MDRSMTMAGVRFADMRLRPVEFLDFTSLTVEEFEILIPPFEAAFQAHMAAWCLDGTPGPPGGFPFIRPARWRRQKIGCSFCSRI